MIHFGVERARKDGVAVALRHLSLWIGVDFAVGIVQVAQRHGGERFRGGGGDVIDGLTGQCRGQREQSAEHESDLHDGRVDW